MNIPYQKHSETSREAAEKYTGKALANKILNDIELSDFNGVIGDEMAVKYNQAIGTIAARLRGLEKDGRIVKTNRNRPTRNNRKASIYVVPKFADEDEILPMKTLTTNEEMRVFIDGLRVHIERYNGISIPKGGAVHGGIKRILAKV